MLYWITKPIIDSIHIQSLLYLLLWFEVFNYKTCRNTSKDLGHNSRTSFWNTFVQRVLDHMPSQDEPIGRNPPTYADLFRGKTRDGPLGHLGRPPEPEPSGVATPQVSSVVQVPGKAKAESDDCPKIQALRARLKQKYGDTFFSGKPVFPPPVRGPYGEAKIRLKQDPGVYRHREFALRGERKV